MLNFKQFNNTSERPISICLDKIAAVESTQNNKNTKLIMQSDKEIIVSHSYEHVMDSIVDANINESIVNIVAKEEDENPFDKDQD